MTITHTLDPPAESFLAELRRRWRERVINHISKPTAQPARLCKHARPRVKRASLRMLIVASVGYLWTGRLKHFLLVRNASKLLAYPQCLVGVREELGNSAHIQIAAARRELKQQARTLPHAS